MDDEEETDEAGAENYENTANSLNEEGTGLLAEAEEEEQAALAAMFQAKKTLKEARQRQHNVKQNRKYYQGAKGSGGRTNPTSTSSTSTSSSRIRDDSNLDCLRCGQRGHRAANCPHKPIGDGTGKASMAQAGGEGTPQQAPFVCYTTPDHEGHVGYVEGKNHIACSTEDPNYLLSTAEAVREGMAVVDGGATQTIGSVAAVEAVLAKNLERCGLSGLAGLSAEKPPTFSFGNSTENQCLSTAKLQVAANGNPGMLQIHTLWKMGQVPYF